MDFRTELNVKPSPIQIGLKDPILTLGSCFAETMGAKFSENKFHVSANPFGTAYHPLAIHKLINYAVFQEYPPEHTFLMNHETHLNYDFHSDFRGSGQDEVRQKIHTAIATAHFFLKECKVLMITYGTGWVYEREETGEGVANCHKMPGKLFAKRLSAIEELKESFDRMLNNLRSVNPGIKLILTVSPVRHVKDTLPLNNLSKSVLRMACHEFVGSHSGVEYFPAYEIMLDDLRDYRFYQDDLIHPTSAAEAYVWEKFSTGYFTKDAIDFISRWTEVRKSLAHRPYNTGTSAHKKFLAELLAQLEELQQHTNVAEEIEDVRSRIAVVALQ